jgi:hypothetical protein
VRWASALVLVAACSDGAPQESPRAAPGHRFRSANPDGSGEIELWGELEGCVVEIRPGVPTSILSICYVDGGGIGGPAIAEELVLVSGKHLVLGEHSYGPLQPPTRVVIDADGVHADGMRLGPLP